MALIKCRYCSAKISDRAEVCPKCGRSTTPEKVGFFEAYRKLWLQAFNFKGISGERDFYFAFICSQIINFILIVTHAWSDYLPLSSSLTELVAGIHFFGTSFCFVSLSARCIRGRSSGGYVGLAVLTLILIFVLMGIILGWKFLYLK